LRKPDVVVLEITSSVQARVAGSTSGWLVTVRWVAARRALRFFSLAGRPRHKKQKRPSKKVLGALHLSALLWAVADLLKSDSALYYY
jgi:hypothetical protein